MLSKKRYAILSLTVVFFSFISGNVCHAEKKSRDPVIVYPSNGEWIEEHAARELAGYAKEMTGDNSHVFKEEDLPSTQKGRLALVGNTKITEGLKKRGLLKLPEPFPCDSFIVQSISDSGKEYLVFSGSNGAGTLYAVYTYLEKCCGIGFFYEGDRIPGHKDLPWEDINIAERPWFELRHGGVVSADYNRHAIRKFSNAYWTLEDWKNAIDWMAKNRFNLMFYPMSFHYVNSLKLPDYRRRIAGEAIAYARQRGIKTVYALDPAPTPDEWQKIVNEVGTDHLYTLYLGSETEEPTQVKIDKIAGGYKAIKALDPAAKFLHETWMFHALGYTGEKAEEFIKGIPDDIILINFPADWLTTEGDISYKKYNYFSGRYWGYGWCHAMYAWDTLFGDLKFYIKQLKEITAMPEGNRCKVWWMMPENPYYFIHPQFGFVLAKLAWNPKTVDEDKIFEEYARLRYPERSAPNMLESVRNLADWLHQRANIACYIFPHHRAAGITTWQRPFLLWNDSYGKAELDESLNEDLSKLRKALDAALLEEKRLKGDRFYEAELTELARTYLTKLSDKHIIKLWFAYIDIAVDYARPRGEDITEKLNRFEYEARAVSTILEQLESILSTRPDYSMVYDCRKILAESNGDTKPLEKIKNFYYVLHDQAYHRVETFEALHHIYRREVEDILIAGLRKRLESAKTAHSFPRSWSLTPEEVNPGIERIKDAYLKNPVEVKEKFKGTTTESVSDAYKIIKEFVID